MESSILIGKRRCRKCEVIFELEGTLRQIQNTDYCPTCKVEVIKITHRSNEWKYRQLRKLGVKT